MPQRYSSNKKLVTLRSSAFRDPQYRILVVLAIFVITTDGLFVKKTIGHDFRYVYVILVSTLLGAIIIGFFRLAFLRRQFAENKELLIRVFMFFYFPLVGIFFSYFSFGQVGRLAWEYFNRKVVEKNYPRNFDCEVTKLINNKGINSIDIMFLGKSERMRIDGESAKKCEEYGVLNSLVKVNATKGLWDYYTINSYEVVRR